MADELWDELQHLELARDDPALFVPHAVYVSVESRNRLSLIARPLNPRSQNLHVVIAALPRSWGLPSIVHGRVINATFVQFLFQFEIDLLFVLRRETWLYNSWFVTAHRWKVNLAFQFLSNIDLWVQMRAIPLLYICEETVVEIAQGLGDVISLDFHDFTTSQIAYIRVRILFDITDSIRFFQRITFDSSITALIRFQYERLRRICSSCFRLTHHMNFCPYREPQHVSLIRGPNHNLVRYGREHLCARAENHRSSLNSQSQMSENSFPAPIEPPPQVAAPTLNHQELVAAYFRQRRATSLPNNPILNQQSSSSRQTVLRDSNIQPFSGPGIGSNAPRLVEVGESSRQGNTRVSIHMGTEGDSSKRKNMGGVRTEENARMHKGFELKDVGILKPPKKR